MSAMKIPTTTSTATIIPTKAPVGRLLLPLLLLVEPFEFEFDLVVGDRVGLDVDGREVVLVKLGCCVGIGEGRTDGRGVGNGEGPTGGDVG